MADDKICSFYYWKSHHCPCRVTCEQALISYLGKRSKPCKRASGKAMRGWGKAPAPTFASPLVCLSCVHFSWYPPNGELARWLHAGLMQVLINLCTLSSDSLSSSMCGTFSALLWRGNTWETKTWAMPSGFQNPSQSDFVVFKLNRIKLGYTARSHSGFQAGFFIACSFSKSLCVSCCEYINFTAILPIELQAYWHSWDYGCASFYSWPTGKWLLAYIEIKTPQYPVSWWGYMSASHVGERSPKARG